MLLYELTAAAQEDPKEIARCTLTQWGEKQSIHYAELLESRFGEMADKTAPCRQVSSRYPQVFVSRCEHHYIFYIHADEKPPCIIAVLHERMDMLKRLKKRLG